MLLAILTTLLITFVILLLFYFFRRRQLNHALPPGPRGVPLLGNMLQMGKNPHIKLSQWAKQYGQFYTIHLAHRPTLVVNDQKLLKELFGQMAATGKFKTEVIIMLTEGSFGILSADGKEWLEQKQFCLRTLKEFGFGRDSHTEPLVIREIDDLCEWMETGEKVENNGRKVWLSAKLKQITTNIVWTLVGGERLSSHESPVVQLLHQLLYYFELATQSGLVFFSWIKYIAPARSGYQGIKKTGKGLHDYVEKCFDEHRNTKINGNPPRDMIDAYLDKNESCQDPQSSFYGQLGWKHCLNSVVGLFLAAGENTSVTLNWMIFYLSAYPQVQKKLQEEIDRVVGASGNISLACKLSMPYCEAVILETLRLSSIAPFGIIHELLEDVEFQGYHLPKGLLLLPNLYHVHHDTNIWGDAKEFRPERFLQGGGEKIKEYVVAFQPGKRRCPGDVISKEILLLFAIKLFQKYTFTPDPDVVDQNEYKTPVVSYTLVPKGLAVVATPRI